MDSIRISVPVDVDDREVTVVIDRQALESACQGREACASVAIVRESAPSLHLRARIERVAA